MCGLAGYYPTNNNFDIAKAMGNSLSHRGPDDEGVWCCGEAGIALIHRRLSILDVSKAGHQPMFSDSQRFVISFNGEIYNHNELRKRHVGYKWSGTSDTETLLVCIERWGLKETLKCCIGMFAIALWDKHTKQLSLARDRFGEKPLYYGWQDETFIFASEIKAIKLHPAFNDQIDRDSLTLFFRHNYIPAPHTIYKGIFKLKPGTVLTISLPSTGKSESSYQYWSLEKLVQRTRENPFVGSDTQAVDKLETVLKQSIESQCLSDVPLGAFLSGGIDSSTIVSLMQSNSEVPVSTFTIGVENDDHNEAVHAKTIAKHLGTSHTELYIKKQDLIDTIPKLPDIYDEPFADSSQIPTYLVAQLTKQHVTVALSGDAGDELFAGYNRYMWVDRVWRNISRLPDPLRKLFVRILTLLPIKYWDRLNRLTQCIQPEHLRNSHLGEKIFKLASKIDNVKGVDDLYYSLVSEWRYPEELVVDGREPKTLLTDVDSTFHFSDHREAMMYKDSMSYLPDDILTKVDRAAMSVGLETRIPMLDHRLVEFAWSLPMHMKIRNGQSKWLLRQVLYRHVPKKLIERPKMGFAVPLDQWLRNDLREWAEELLDEKKIKQQGFLNPKPIQQCWKEHLSGSRNWYYSLWSVLMFQAWVEHQN